MSEIINKAFANIDPENERFVNKNVDIIEEIHRLLSVKGWSQAEFAQQLGKSSAEVSKWLSGTHNLTLRSITKMESALSQDIIMSCSEAKQKFQTVNYVHINKDAQRNNTINNSLHRRISFVSGVKNKEPESLLNIA